MFSYACNDPHEDSYHIFFYCKTVIDVWSAANVWHLISPLLNLLDNAPDIIFNLLQQLSTAQIETMVTIMWRIWKARNLKLWQQMSGSTVTSLERAKHLLEGWRSDNRKQNPLSQVHAALTTCLHQHDD